MSLPSSFSDRVAFIKPYGLDLDDDEQRMLVATWEVKQALAIEAMEDQEVEPEMYESFEQEEPIQEDQTS